MHARLVFVLALGSALGACASEPGAPPVPEARIVDFGDACTPANDGAELQVVGFVDAFPTALSCSEGIGGARLCPVSLYAERSPVLDPEVRDTSDSSASLTLNIPEGNGPNRVEASGFGAGPALVLIAADGTRADPYDRLRVTGAFSADAEASGGTEILCRFDEVRSVEIVEPASPSWQESTGQDETMDTFLDSLNAERSQVE